MNEIQIFSNAAFGEVRVAGTSEQPLFCLADVCRVLEIKNVSDCKSRLKQDGVVLTEVIDSLGRTQDAAFINEQNLYKVIMRSDKPQAEPFQDWVCGDVLPSIRKHGGYLTPEKVEEALLNPDTLIRIATALKEERAKRIAAECEVAKLEPKGRFADAVAASDRSVLISELAKILRQNGVNIGQNRLFEWMRLNGYLCSKGEYYNQPTQKSMELALFEIKKTSITKPDGSVLVTTTTKVTGKGQIYFVNKFLADRAA